MENHSAANRLLNITTPFHDAEFFLTHLKGKEVLGQSFVFTCQLLCKHSTISAKKILGKSVTISIQSHPEQSKCFNGVVKTIINKGIDKQGFCHYELVMTSWFELLKLKTDCRIFQNQSVLEIFISICQQFGFTAYCLNKLSKTYEPQPLAVQFNESSYDFLQGLFQDAGIYYYFIHNKSSHTMVLVDSDSYLSLHEKAILFANISQTESYIFELQPYQQLHSHNLVLSDYHYQQSNQLCTVKLNQASNLNHLINWSSLKKTQNPGLFQTVRQGEKRLKQYQQALVWKNNATKGKSHVPELNLFEAFRIRRYDNKQCKDLRIIQIEHEASELFHQPNYEKQTTQAYANEFIAIDSSIDHYPAPVFKQKKISNPQIAKVIEVHQGGIHSNTNACVQVQFHWQDRKNPKCKAWVRVNQMLADKNFGSQFIPRVGDEVLIAFENANATRPIILGSQYNSDIDEALALPGKQNKNGLITQTKGSKNALLKHRFIFDDTPKKESLQIHSCRDVNIHVQQDFNEGTSKNKQVETKQSIKTQVDAGGAEFKAKAFVFKVGQSEIHFNQSGLSIKSANIFLKTKGITEKQALIRVGDHHVCDKNTNGVLHQGGKVMQGSKLLKVNQKNLARVGDKAFCHVKDDVIKTGVNSITVKNKPIATIKSQFKHGGSIQKGSSNVFVTNRDKLHSHLFQKSEESQIFFKPCEFKNFIIKCQHQQRTYQLNASNAKPNHKNNHELQVIASSNIPDKITLQFTGRCNNPNPPNHGQDCPALKIITPEKTFTHLGNYTLAVYSSKRVNAKDDFEDFFDNVLLPNGLANIYQVIPLCCSPSNANAVTIIAFAAVKWQGEVSIACQPNSKQNDSLLEKSFWHIKGFIKIVRNQTGWVLGNDKCLASQKNKRHRKIFRRSQRFIDHFIPTFTSLKNQYADFKIHWPNISFSGDIRNAEVNDAFHVENIGHIRIDFKPFLGISADLDILNWLILIAGEGVLGKYLVAVKKRAAEGVGFKEVNIKTAVKVILSASANMEGYIQWQKQPSHDWKTAGGVAVDFPLKIKGSVSSALNVFVLHCAAEVSISAQSGFSIQFQPSVLSQDTSMQPAVTTQCGFNGLTIYWAYYYSVLAKSYFNMGKSDPWIPTLNKQGNLSIKKRYENKFNVIAPIYIPKKLQNISLREFIH